ncbi:MAG: hypothetical protein ACK5LM_02340 [Lactovum sp.]
MNLFNLFKKEKKEEREEKPQPQNQEWETIPAYLPIEDKDYELLSIIVAAIIAADKENTKIKIKRIWKKNPEFELLSVLSSAIAVVNNNEENYLKIKNILKKKEE